MASSELGASVLSELQGLGINTQEEVKNFRVPGERRVSTTSPSQGRVNTVVAAIQTALGRQWVSRRRVRHDALELLKEGSL